MDGSPAAPQPYIPGYRHTIESCLSLDSTLRTRLLTPSLTQMGPQEHTGTPWTVGYDTSAVWQRRHSGGWSRRVEVGDLWRRAAKPARGRSWRSPLCRQGQEGVGELCTSQGLMAISAQRVPGRCGHLSGSAGHHSG